MNIGDTFKKRIEEQVIESMGSLFPPEELKILIDGAVKKFFMESDTFRVVQNQQDRWSATEKLAPGDFKVSPFEYLVFNKIRSLINGSLETYFEEEKSNLKAQLDEAIRSDVEFQGRMTTNIAKMALYMQELQMMHFAVNSTETLKNELRDRLTHHGIYI